MTLQVSLQNSIKFLNGELSHNNLCLQILPLFYKDTFDYPLKNIIYNHCQNNGFHFFFLENRNSQIYRIFLKEPSIKQIKTIVNQIQIGDKIKLS